MEFLDKTGHVFSLPSYGEEPVGFEYNENPYIFWIDDEYTNKLSINNYYIKPIRCLVLGNGEKGLSTDEEGMFWENEETANYFYDINKGANNIVNESEVIVYWNYRKTPIWYDGDKRWTDKTANTKNYKIELNKGKYIKFSIKDYTKFVEDGILVTTGSIVEKSYNKIEPSNKNEKIINGECAEDNEWVLEKGTPIYNYDTQILLKIDDLYRITLTITDTNEVIKWNERVYIPEIHKTPEDIIKENNTIKNISIKSDSEVYKLLGSKQIQELIEGNKSFKEYLELDENMFKTELTLDDICLISDLYVNANTNYIMIPFYVVGKVEESGTWVSNILINVDYLDNVDNEDEYCPISVGGVYEEECEELIINGINYNIKLPKDILKSIYQNSFYNEYLNETLYNEKLKELLLNYMNIKGEVGNYRSMLHALEWFGYGDKISLSALWRNDNEFMNQYLHDYFDINDDFIYSFKHFRNSTYIALRVKENQETNIYEKQQFDNDWMWGEGKPLMENLFSKNVVVTYDEGDILFYRGYYDYIWEELGLKLSALKYYYEKYFLPIHISIHSSTLAHQVHLNDMKMIVAPFNKITERPQYIEDYDIDVVFPTNTIQFFFNQLHYVDEFYNEYTKYYGDKKYFLLDTCLSIPIKFIRKSNYKDILYKDLIDEPEDTIYNCIMIITKSKSNNINNGKTIRDFNDNNYILLENHFSFCQKYSGNKLINDYENFVLYPNSLYELFNKTNKLPELKGDWIDSTYNIYLNCNGKWFYYQFKSKLHELKYFISKLEYKYDYIYNNNNLGFLAYQNPGEGKMIEYIPTNTIEIGEFVSTGKRRRVFINNTFNKVNTNPANRDFYYDKTKNKNIVNDSLINVNWDDESNKSNNYSHIWYEEITEGNSVNYVEITELRKPIEQAYEEESIIDKYLNSSINKCYNNLLEDIPIIENISNNKRIASLKLIYLSVGIEALWGSIINEYNNYYKKSEYKINIYIEKVNNNEISKTLNSYLDYILNKVSYKQKLSDYEEEIYKYITKEDIPEILDKVYTFTKFNPTIRYPFKQISYIDEDIYNKGTDNWNPIINFNSFMWKQEFANINNNNFIRDLINNSKHNKIKNIIESKTSLNIYKLKQLYNYFLYGNIKIYVDNNLIYKLNQNKYKNIIIKPDGTIEQKIVIEKNDLNTINYKSIIKKGDKYVEVLTELNKNTNEIIKVDLYIPKEYLENKDNNSCLIVGLIQDDLDSIYLIKDSEIGDYNNYEVIGKINEPYINETSPRIKLRYKFPESWTWLPFEEGNNSLVNYIHKEGKINVEIFDENNNTYVNSILFSENYVDTYNLLDSNSLYISNKNYLNHIVIFDIYDGNNEYLKYKGLKDFDYDIIKYNRYLYRMYSIFFSNSTSTGYNNSFEVQDIFSNNDDYYEHNLNDYDFYLMHDDKYWYGVFISKYTYYNIGTIYRNIGDIIKFKFKYLWDEFVYSSATEYLNSNSVLEINESNVYPEWNKENGQSFDLDNPDIYYDSNYINEDNQVFLYLKYSKSEYKFLINRYDLTDTFNSINVNHYKPTDMLCAQIFNNNRIDLNTSTQVKWNISPIVDKNKINYSGNNELFIFNYNSNMFKGYYSVRLQYSLAPYLSNKTFTSETKIKIISN